jgi:3,4-dihydroxy 2-butanone 4-phosphate synthase / GTP cyclohydrolase II
MPISPISEIIDDLRRGRMVVLMDDEDRENEGDLLMVAEHVRPEDVNFMARYGRGLICLTLTEPHCRQLQLPLMASSSHARRSTAFTVSIEAAEGVTTGISAADRARTIQVAVKPDAGPSDIVTPGHVFPLMASRGGVLARAGHTEAGVDLARLAGFGASAVICEIMNDDGTMARLPQLAAFAQTHRLKIGTIADLIRYRMENEPSIQRVAETTLATEFGDFRVVTYHDDIIDAMHLALVKGEIRREQPTLVRVQVHSSPLDGLPLAQRGHWNARRALERVAEEGAGVVVMLEQRETREQLIARIRDVQARGERLELSSTRDGSQEMRTYGLGSQIVADLGVGRMRVMGPPMKAPALSGFGLEIVEYVDAPTATLHPVPTNKDKKASR